MNSKLIKQVSISRKERENKLCYILANVFLLLGEETELCLGKLLRPENVCNESIS
jgi:hypothetical protein